jgi:hypothetical protein
MSELQTHIQLEKVLYQHRPVNGLPASLLAKEGRTFAAIALMMRQAGLNRERRREMQNGVKAFRDLGHRLGSKIDDVVSSGASHAQLAACQIAPPGIPAPRSRHKSCPLEIETR